jgi:hypothetical protein
MSLPPQEAANGDPKKPRLFWCQRLIAGVDLSPGSGQPVTLTGDLGMSFAHTSPRGSSLQFHVMVVYLPKVTLDAKRVIDVAANDTFNDVDTTNPWLANGAKAYVPVNNDDDDNDGKIDSTQAVVNLVDDDLLPIALRKNAADPRSRRLVHG